MFSRQLVHPHLMPKHTNGYNSRPIDSNDPNARKCRQGLGRLAIRPYRFLLSPACERYPTAGAAFLTANVSLTRPKGKTCVLLAAAASAITSVTG